MTQHGSFPGRPRGRRARQEGDAPGWQGHDAAPEDQREFPDLSPIRPRGPGARYPQGGQPPVGQPPAGQPPLGGPAAGQRGGGQYNPGQQGSGQYGGGYPGGYGGPAQQPPWDEQPWPATQDQGQAAGYQPPPVPSHPAPAQPAQFQPAQSQSALSQPAGPSSPPAESGPSRRTPAARSADDETPSWAEPDSIEAFSERWHRRGLDSRDERRDGRRSRRRLLIAAGTTLALVIGAAIYLLEGGPGAANLGFGTFVTSFLPGELQQVPDPCTTLPAATLNQYMPGQLKEAAPPLNSGLNTECTWTLDSPPTYRVLQVQLQAYSPSGLASGNGSATFAAQDAFQSAESGFTSPGPKSGQPKATVTDVSGMPGGNDTSAFQATQVFNRGGATTDVANLLVRYRNVIVTVVVDGLDQTGGGKKYGPVSMTDLTAEASAVATEMAAQIAK